MEPAPLGAANRRCIHLVQEGGLLAHQSEVGEIECRIPGKELRILVRHEHAIRVVRSHRERAPGRPHAVVDEGSGNQWKELLRLHLCARGGGGLVNAASVQSDTGKSHLAVAGRLDRRSCRFEDFPESDRGPLSAHRHSPRSQRAARRASRPRPGALRAPRAARRSPRRARPARSPRRSHRRHSGGR
jgi:hypothetical protein